MAVSDGAQQLVVFSLGDEEYALPITQVQEIIRYTEPRAVASEEPWIEGVISLRGKIIPVCDLAGRLGLANERFDNAKIVIVETAGGTAGVTVDEVEEVLTLGEGRSEHSTHQSGVVDDDDAWRDRAHVRLRRLRFRRPRRCRPS